MEANIKITCVAMAIKGRIRKRTSSIKSNVCVSKFLCLCGAISGKVNGASGVKTNNVNSLLPVDFLKD